MTYTDRYNAIIYYFQRHPVDKTKIYCECHHIRPKSCGGSNDKENLVNLPAAWHYRVHCYLPFVMLEQNNKIGYSSMLNAWRRMLNSEKEKIDLLKINEESILYERLRKEFALNVGKQTTISQAGSKNSQYGKHWWKDPNDKTKSLSIKEGDPVPEGWVRGKWQTFSEKGLKNIREGTKKNIRHFMITNGEINRWIKKDEPIPEGFWKGMRIKGKVYIKKELQEKKKLTEEELHQIRSEASKRSNETKRNALREKNYPILKEQYEFWLNHTWSEFVEKYDYKYTQVNFNNQCKKYLGKEWHPKRNFTLAKS